MSCTWNSANLGETVPGEGPITLRYFDTHPGTKGEPYTTIIATHGMGCNSNLWKSYIPYLPVNTRLLAYNQRGYQGSTPSFGTANPDDINVDATKRDTLDLLGFLRFAVEELGVPPMSMSRQNGGIVILGWSRGCFPLVGLLANLPTRFKGGASSFELPIALAPYHQIIETHLRSLILFEPPGSICGLVEPGQQGLLDSYPHADRGRVFIEFLKMTMPEDKRHLLDEAADVDPIVHGMGTWLASTPEECARVAELALQDIPRSLRVGLVYCTGSVPSILDSAKWFTERLAGQPNTVVRTIHGGDHFAMATIPQEFASGIESVIATFAEMA